MPLVKDPKLAEDMRGFIGQEATHADGHQQVLHDLMVARDVDPKPLLDQVDFIFSRTLAPSTSPDPKRRLSHLCDRLWLIAAIEHYTAVLAQRSKEDRRQSSGTVPAWTCGHHRELGSVPVASQLPSKDGYHRPTTGGK